MYITRNTTHLVLGLTLSAALVGTQAIPAFAADSTTSTPQVTLAVSTLKVSNMGASVVLRGKHLDGIKTAKLSGKSLTMKSRSSTSIKLVFPAAKNYKTTTKSLKLTISKGYKSPKSKTVKIKYVTNTAVGRQMNYAMRHISSKNSSYPYFKDNNCQNFVSQTLKARGWSQSKSWYAKSRTSYSMSFIRVMTFHKLITTKAAYKKRVKILGTDSQATRAKVHVGDLVFAYWNKKKTFRWNHVMIVSKITKSKSGHINIYMAGNTLNLSYRSLDKLKKSTRDYYGSGKNDYIKLYKPTFQFVKVR